MTGVQDFEIPRSAFNASTPPRTHGLPDKNQPPEPTRIKIDVADFWNKSAGFMLVLTLVRLRQKCIPGSADDVKLHNQITVALCDLEMSGI